MFFFIYFEKQNNRKEPLKQRQQTLRPSLKCKIKVVNAQSLEVKEI